MQKKVIIRLDAHYSDLPTEKVYVQGWYTGLRGGCTVALVNEDYIQEGWIETNDRGAAEFLTKMLTTDDGTIGDTYHTPNGTHPPTCRGCTLDASRHGKPILSAPWVIYNPKTNYLWREKESGGVWTNHFSRATRYISQADAAKVVRKEGWNVDNHNVDVVHEMNLPSKATMSVMERMNQRQKEEKERHQQLRGFALEQGLILIQISSMRYMVVRLNGGSRTLNGSVYGGPDHEGKWYTHLSAEVVLVKATYEEVHKWMCANGLPLPDSLKPTR